MRKPLDLHAELQALNDKAEQLKAEHRSQLLELLERTKADQLPAEVIAGLLLDGVAKTEAGDAAAEDWRRKGNAFFHKPPRHRRSPATPQPAPAPTDQAAPAA